MNISFVKYVTNILDGENSSIKAVIDNKEWSVPLDPANRHYAAIMEQVGLGTLSIAEDDNGE